MTPGNEQSTLCIIISAFSFAYDRFCRFHGESHPAVQTPPRELICCAELLIPHLLRVFIRALRVSTISGTD